MEENRFHRHGPIAPLKVGGNPRDIHRKGASVDIAEYARLDAIGLARAVGAGETEPAEVRAIAVAALETIREWRAVFDVYSDAALNHRRGILSGIPILHKDGGAQIAGLPREYGSLLGRGSVCTTTSHFFETILAQGGQVVGRSQVPELHMSVLGDNAIFGSTINPWNPTLSMGGSTAGVAAVALGAVPVAHGGDSGGSLRVPASWAGCYTLKPTTRRISSSPGGTELLGLNEIFVVTRSLRDLRLFLGALHNPAIDDLPSHVGPESHWTCRSRRIGLCESFYAGLPVDPAIIDTVRRFALSTERLGYYIEPAELHLNFEEICEVLYIIGSLDLRMMVDSLTVDAATAVSQLCQPYVARWYSDTEQIRPSEIMAVIDAIGQVGRRFRKFVSRYDFLVMPVTARQPPPVNTVHAIGAENGSRILNQRFEEIVHFCAAPTMGGNPALVIPYAETDSDIPCGVQIVGRPGDDFALLDFAEIFDRGFVSPRDFIG